MQDGFYACNTPPYGYKKDPDEQGKLIIDIEPAKIIRKIFELKANGLTRKEIAEYLNKKEIQTPANYLKIKGMPTDVVQIWTTVSVGRILCNKVYLGYCIRGKTQNISYKTKKRIYAKSNELIIVKNTHAPIVSEELYNAAHKEKNTIRKIKKRIPKDRNTIWQIYILQVLWKENTSRKFKRKNKSSL